MSEVMNLQSHGYQPVEVQQTAQQKMLSDLYLGEAQLICDLVKEKLNARLLNSSGLVSKVEQVKSDMLLLEGSCSSQWMTGGWLVATAAIFAIPMAAGMLPVMFVALRSGDKLVVLLSGGTAAIFAVPMIPALMIAIPNFKGARQDLATLRDKKEKLAEVMRTAEKQLQQPLANLVTDSKIEEENFPESDDRAGHYLWAMEPEDADQVSKALEAANKG